MITTPGIHDIPEKEYRADPAISHSDLRKFVGRHTKGSGRNLITGSAFHKMVLRPDDPSEYHVMEGNPKLNTKAGKAELADVEAATGKVCLKEQEGQTLTNLINGLRENEQAMKIIAAPGDTEVCMFAELQEGIMSKGMADKITRGCIWDLKTTYASSPEEFLTSVAKFGYANQSAHYQDIYLSITGKWLDFGWICCSTKTYECWVQMATPFMYHVGHLWVNDVLGLLHKEQRGIEVVFSGGEK